jgi:hypothetical protein
VSLSPVSCISSDGDLRWPFDTYFFSMPFDTLFSSMQGASGDLTEVELESLVRDAGLREQASQLVALRVKMLGAGADERDSSLSFAAADFLEILECRQLAAQQGRSRGRKKAVVRGGLGLEPIDETLVAGPRKSIDLRGDHVVSLGSLGSKGRSWHHLDTLETSESIADDEWEDGDAASPVVPGRTAVSSPLAKALRPEGGKRTPKRRKQKLERIITVHGSGLYASLMKNNEADNPRTHSLKQ